MKKVCVFQTQSICHRPYRAGRRQAPRPTRLSVKLSPCRRYGPRASALDPMSWMLRLKHSVVVSPLCGSFVAMAYDTLTSARCASYVPNELSPLTRLDAVLRGLKPTLHAAASRRHEDKFDSSASRRRARPHFNSFDLRL